jgi:transposase InsO family protein
MKGVSVAGLCACSGMSKQAYYKDRRERRRREIDEELVLELVRAERRLQPRLGARKLLVLIGPELSAAGVSIGRDRFFALLREHGLLVVRRRARAPRTTDSRHWMRVWPNLLKDFAATGPHQAWVSDLTYLRTREGFLYLSLVMDAFSRKIVGWHVGATLEAMGCVAALWMALAQRPPGESPIHHSDRGTQYCCGDYVGLLERSGVAISMTEENHCYENARAERLNGILKQEYGLDGEFARKSEVERVVAEAVKLYNQRRPHVALGYKTPAVVHGEGTRAAA